MVNVPYVVGSSLSCYVQLIQKYIFVVYFYDDARALRCASHGFRHTSCASVSAAGLRSVFPRDLLQLGVSALIRSLCPPREKSHGLQKEEQEPPRAEPRVCDPESRGHGVVCGHGRPAGAHV